MAVTQQQRLSDSGVAHTEVHSAAYAYQQGARAVVAELHQQLLQRGSSSSLPLTCVT